MSGIKGNMFRIIKDMYYNSVVQIKHATGLSDEICLNRGVKQGCVLSPTLFNIFINDLPSQFDDSCDPVLLYNKKISCLLYADDLILLSRSESGLQTCLNKLKVYCDEWNLRVNIKKSKILIFNKTGKLIESHFVLGTD